MVPCTCHTAMHGSGCHHAWHAYACASAQPATAVPCRARARARVHTTHHARLVVEDEAARDDVHHRLHARQRLEQDVGHGDECLAQQRAQLTHAVRRAQPAPAHGLQLVVAHHLRGARRRHARGGRRCHLKHSCWWSHRPLQPPASTIHWYQCVCVCRWQWGGGQGVAAHAVAAALTSRTATTKNVAPLVRLTMAWMRCGKLKQSATVRRHLGQAA